MDSVLRVVLQIWKTYCGKNAPSKKDIAAVASCLESARLLPSPGVLLDSGRWDSFTEALLQRAARKHKAKELKTWGLVLGALKAAREEKQVQAIAKGVFGLDSGTSGVSGGAGDLLSCSDSGSKMASATPADSKMAMAALETTPEKKAEAESSKEAPPSYPRLYPSLQSFHSPEGGGSCPEGGGFMEAARRGGVGSPSPQKTDIGFNFIPGYSTG